jgi:hypothetical protein
MLVGGADADSENPVQNRGYGTAFLFENVREPSAVACDPIHRVPSEKRQKPKNALVVCRFQYNNVCTAFRLYFLLPQHLRHTCDPLTKGLLRLFKAAPGAFGGGAAAVAVEACVGGGSGAVQQQERVWNRQLLGAVVVPWNIGHAPTLDRPMHSYRKRHFKAAGLLKAAIAALTICQHPQNHPVPHPTPTLQH